MIDLEEYYDDVVCYNCGSGDIDIFTEICHNCGHLVNEDFEDNFLDYWYNEDYVKVIKGRSL